MTEAGRAGQFTVAVMGFGRLLRQAGLPIGPDRIITALEALTVTGVARRDEVHSALAAALLGCKADRALFDQAFQLYWRDTALTADPGANPAETPVAPLDPELNRRLAEALRSAGLPRPMVERRRADLSLTFSADETLATRDFADMTTAELAAAEQALRALPVWLTTRLERRLRPGGRRGAIDIRAMVRRSAQHLGEPIPLIHRKRAENPPPVVFICDISGSMDRYARMVLVFAHQLMAAQDRVSCFLFGTRLTNATPVLRQRDIDVALTAAGRLAPDWGGGTRIGESLSDFNRLWSRRVLARGGIVLLITDGLDRGKTEQLAAEMARLKRSCSRLIWLNPLLRWDDFEPRAAGIRAILPHVEAMRPVHTLNSLADLLASLRLTPLRLRETA